LRVPPSEFQALDVVANRFLAGVPLADVNVVDLPAGGPGRTIADVRALAPEGDATKANVVVRMLFGLRFWLGRVFGWDRGSAAIAPESYLHRMDSDLRARSLCAPGTPDGPFRVLYMLESESLSEIRNATVHAFLATALRPTPTGYRLYWAVYVLPVSRLTGLYMALIEPFRRLVVYPAILGRIRRAWQRRYAG
jgi:hypothetical protein